MYCGEVGPQCISSVSHNSDMPFNKRFLSYNASSGPHAHAGSNPRHASPQAYFECVCVSSKGSLQGYFHSFDAP